MPGSQAHVSSEAINVFSGRLKTLIDRVYEFDENMIRKLDQLGETCGDERYDDFRTEVERSRTLLRRFLKETTTILPMLTAEAKVIQQTEQQQVRRR